MRINILLIIPQFKLKKQCKIYQCSSVHQFISRTPFKLVKVIIFVSFIFSSCKNKEIVPNSNIIKTEESSHFFGLKINLIDPIVTKNDLINYEKQEKSFLENKLAKINVLKPEDYSNISDEKMYEWIDKEIKKFPNLDNDLPTKTELAFIKKIFPDIKTTDDFLKNKSVIFDYLNMIVSLNLKEVLKTDLLKNKEAKIRHNDDGSKNGMEIQNGINDPVYSAKVYNSSFDANQICREIFNDPNINLDLNDNVNAIRHASWNMCSVSKIAQVSLNKWKGLQHAEVIITAHEYRDIPNSYEVRDINTSTMDAYNNLVGRTYCYNTIGQTWLGNANNIPSYNKIKADVQNLTIVTVPATDQNAIYSLSTPNLNTLNLLGTFNVALDYGNSTISQKLVRF